jgi:SAM-dependent methyltransferase
MKKFSNSIQERLTARHLKCFQASGNLVSKRILDIGPSFGWFERMALGSGCAQVIGLEPKSENFYAAQIEVPEAQFIEGSALNIPFENDTFDVVVMFDVIEHLPKGSESLALSEIYRVLRRGGRMILSTPFKHPLSCAFDPAWYFGHRHYSVKVLKSLAIRSSFTIENVEVRGGYYEMVSALMMYFFKWMFNAEIPFKSWFESKKEEEYLGSKKGIETLYLSGIKS